MKFKLLFALVVAFAALFSFQSKKGNIDLLLENIEALANDEHGQIDPTLKPYGKLGSKELSFIIDGEIITTTVPCCESDPSPYSGCAAGLGSC